MNNLTDLDRCALVMALVELEDASPDNVSYEVMRRSRIVLERGYADPNYFSTLLHVLHSLKETCLRRAAARRADDRKWQEHYEKPND